MNAFISQYLPPPIWWGRCRSIDSQQHAARSAQAQPGTFQWGGPSSTSIPWGQPPSLSWETLRSHFQFWFCLRKMGRPGRSTRPKVSWRKESQIPQAEPAQRWASTPAWLPRQVCTQVFEQHAHADSADQEMWRGASGKVLSSRLWITAPPRPCRNPAASPGGGTKPQAPKAQTVLWLLRQRLPIMPPLTWHGRELTRPVTPTMVL